MSRFFLVVASILGGVSVALGAFGAHGLKKIVTPETVATFETGVRYQFYHSFAILAIGILLDRVNVPALVWSGYLFLTGVVFFSGSLYVLTILKATQQVGGTGIGIITPFGGLFLIAGWIMLLVGVLKR